MVVKIEKNVDFAGNPFCQILGAVRQLKGLHIFE